MTHSFIDILMFMNFIFSVLPFYFILVNASIDMFMLCLKGLMSSLELAIGEISFPYLYAS